MKWIAEFLENRYFRVKINNFYSSLYQIRTGVPQGGVLSPVLFSIFINDIIKDTTSFRKTKVFSNLFADDLSASCSSHYDNVIENAMNKYLKKLEDWLKLWRLSINANKCQYLYFSKNRKLANKELKLSLFKDKIPKTDNVKFLGIKYDQNMTFNSCVEEVYRKCLNRLNIIKIISHKSWKLESKTLINIYKSLIRSIIDYIAIIFPIISETCKQKIRAIQYHALRTASRKPIKISHKSLIEECKVETIDNRADNLNKRYFENCFIYNNELVMEIVEQYLRAYPISRSAKFKTILCNYRETIQEYQ